MNNDLSLEYSEIKKKKAAYLSEPWMISVGKRDREIEFLRMENDALKKEVEALKGYIRTSKVS